MWLGRPTSSNVVIITNWLGPQDLSCSPQLSLFPTFWLNQTDGVRIFRTLFCNSVYVSAWVFPVFSIAIPTWQPALHQSDPPVTHTASCPLSHNAHVLICVYHWSSYPVPWWKDWWFIFRSHTKVLVFILCHFNHYKFFKVYFVNVFQRHLLNS